MKNTNRHISYITLLAIGVFLCIASGVIGVAMSDTLLALGSGIVTSTIVSFLINAKSERDIERQKNETRDALLQKMAEQAESVLYQLLIRINQFYERINPENIVFPYMNGDFMLRCMKAHEKSDIKNEVLAFKLEDIRNGFLLFWSFDLDLNNQPESIQRCFSDLFCKNNSFIATYLSGLGSISSDSLFAMGLITKDQKDLLPTYSETNSLKALQPPSNNIKNLDVANAQLMIDALCQFCMKTYEGIWKIRNPKYIFHPNKEYDEINKKCAKFLLDELYCWHDDVPAHIIYRNIFRP